MYYMKKTGNKVTLKVSLSSQNERSGCELVVNQNASYALINNNLSVPLRNKQGKHQKPEYHDAAYGFIHSLFALNPLFFRFKSEATAIKMNLKCNLIISKTKSYGNISKWAAVRPYRTHSGCTD